jgi:hypothetical protein
MVKTLFQLNHPLSRSHSCLTPAKDDSDPPLARNTKRGEGNGLPRSRCSDTPHTLEIETARGRDSLAVNHRAVSELEHMPGRNRQ